MLNIIMVDEDKCNKIVLVLPENDEEGLPDLDDEYCSISGQWSHSDFYGRLTLHDEEKNGKQRHFLKAVCHWASMGIEWEMFLELPNKWIPGQHIMTYEAPRDVSKSKWSFQVMSVKPFEWAEKG